MRHVLFAHWGMGFLLLFGVATSGCKRSQAAQPPASYPAPPDSYPAPPTNGHSSIPIPAEPCFTEDEEHDRTTLLAKFSERLPLLEPDKAESSQFEAKTKLIDTFHRWLPEELRKRIEVSQPTCTPTRTACYVDVSYPDWKTFVEVNRAVLDSPGESPFAAYRGARYRTGRVRAGQKGKRFMSSWILALPMRPPREAQYTHSCIGGKDPFNCNPGREQ